MSTCEAVVTSLKKDYNNVKKASVHCFYCIYCCLNAKIKYDKMISCTVSYIIIYYFRSQIKLNFPPHMK